MIFEVRDEAEETRGKNNTPIWDGVFDKRLLVVEEELASVFKNSAREGNTLSPILRSAWDGNDLSPMTKNNRLKATAPHVNILGHITEFELTAILNKQLCEAHNGLLNRFLWFSVRRQKLVPLPRPMDDQAVYQLAIELSDIIKYAKDHAGDEIAISNDATLFWHKIYPKISIDLPGLLGAITTRGEAYTIRIALLFAMLDKSIVIETTHIQAAYDLVVFSMRSARYIFTTPLDGTPDAQKILNALNERNMTQSEISRLFQNHKSRDELSKILGDLQSLNKIKRLQEKGNKTIFWKKI